MPDTPTNQAQWPQSSGPKAGSGFPSGRICALFCLDTGSLLSYSMGNRKNHELPLFRKNWSTFRKEDIFLGDKSFCSYFDIGKLKDRGVDSIVALARRKPVSRKQCLKELGDDDLFIEWPKPPYNKILSYSREIWESLPPKHVMRQIKVTVTQPGFRCKQFYIVTTLLDSEKYPRNEITTTYFKRWEVELFFRDLKTTMGFDILRCRSPFMVRKEMLMYFIAYTCLRRLISESTGDPQAPVKTISFKGCLQAVRNWESCLRASELTHRERLKILSDLHLAIADHTVQFRPGRAEPRCLKRRPKPYQLMTKPRHEMKEIQHRNRYTASCLN